MTGYLASICVRSWCCWNATLTFSMLCAPSFTAVPGGNRECFHRLRSAGVLAGEAVEAARFRCPLYASYLNQHLS